MHVSQSRPGMPVSGIFCSGVSVSPRIPPPRRLLVMIAGYGARSGKNFLDRSGVISRGVSHHSTSGL